MKINFKRIKTIDTTKLCARMGYFDEHGRYCEARCDNVDLKNLPNHAINKVKAGHDILVHALSKSHIIVFAKNAHDIDKYVAFLGADHLLELLVALSKYSDSAVGGFWATYDFPAEI